MSMTRLLAFASLFFAATAGAQIPTGPAVQPPKSQAESPAQAAPTPTRALRADDVGTWFDGMIPWALARAEIAGAVVTVVKDGQVLFARGYGYADVEKRKPVDPDQTLFRIGSTSKLFTWTAVMQQVERGKLDLDRDVNAYLDFRIPDAFGKPITLRNLMTHTAGFQETLKDLFTDHPESIQLGDSLRTHVPPRIYPPGEIIAYSNYGAALAGYIAQRASGKDFSDYVESEIYAPLGMSKASFRQPLPAALQPGMSNGYELASQPPRPYENIPLFPAGSMAATATDMAKFMIAHLSHGGPLLKPETAARMYDTAKAPAPGFNGMALGFYHEDRNGRRIVAHGGDTNLFHTDLWLLLDENVGLFVSFNSAGKEGVTNPLRTAILRGFLDRYFPAPALPDESTLPTARQHGQEVAGAWMSSRGGEKSWLRLLAPLSPANLELNQDDTISFSALTNAGDAPKKWREVQPFVWREVNGPSRLTVLRDGDGRPTLLTNDDFAPVFVFLPTSFATGPAALQLLIVALLVLTAAVLAWPAAALIRRHYGHGLRLEGRDRLHYRLSRMACLVLLLFALGWIFLVLQLNGDLAIFSSQSDNLFWLLRLVGVLAVAGALLLLWRAATVWRDARFAWWGRIANTAIALAALVIVWASFAYNLLGVSLQY